MSQSLIRDIVASFGSRFAPGSRPVYTGDTAGGQDVWDAPLLAELGVKAARHDKMPDVVLHDPARNRLLLIASAPASGPIDDKRREELKRMFGSARADLVYVTAFPSRAVMRRHLGRIAWQTEAWVADAPSHLIHFGGEKLLGPYAS